MNCTSNYYEICDLEHYSPGSIVTIRARIHKIRAQSRIIFIVLRQGTDTVQGVFLKKDQSEEMISYISNIPKESIVDVTAVINDAKPPIKSCTIHFVELNIKEVMVVSRSINDLPIQIDEHIYLPEIIPQTESNKLPQIESKIVTRLNNRVIDLRRADNQFIFRFQSEISRIIRNFFIAHDFMEIHSPKLIGAASEGGSNVFEVKYFNQNAYLAQSPQLYKQMAICSDFPRVYEIGPVFRAEKSFTHRHLTEFTGIDLEMTFNKNYHEILDMFDNLFINLFGNLRIKFGPKIDEFSKELGVEPFEFVKPSVRITYQDAIGLLRADGVDMADYDDFNTEKERILGRIIKQKYHTDFFMVDKFPSAIRPFYTMPDKENPLYSNSYDFFIRGEEILSGAQRINDYDMLRKSANDHGIDTSKITDYLDAFKYGVPLHGGGGIGLERVVMLYLGINNIRNVSLFPRDPTRITP